MADDTPPAAIPWYRSRIIQGIVAGVVAQVISRLQAQYHFDITVWGFTANDIVSAIMDGITAIAVAYTAHARVMQTTAPQIVSNQPKADVINEEAKK